MLSGDTGTAEGKHQVVWDLDKQGISIQSTNVTFTVTYEWPLYCVVDLSSASPYPVTYMYAPPSGGFNTDTYKTTKLVLRKIEAGTFTMGSPTSEANRSSYETQHQVTLSKPYYIGLFEVTQKQYALVVKSNNGYPSIFSGDKRPVESVSWNTIRGDTNWPASSAVSTSSFMGLFRAKTRLGDFDLPTEAQWEYACRAGTTTAYSYGASANGDYMWYSDNSSNQTHEVGMKNPNAWGLYDMHGNVWEWCLDWYKDDLWKTAVTDPKGASSGSTRVVRGGSWSHLAVSGRSAKRSDDFPSDGCNHLGFRLSRILSECGQAGTSAAVTVRTQGLPVVGHAVTGYLPFWMESGAERGVWLDGAVLFSSVGEATFDWQPQTTGNHKIEFRLNGVSVTSKTVNVSSLAFWVQKGPNPPTAVDGNLSITPVTRNFGVGGGGAAIVVSGSGTWQASVSDPWITLNATSGAAGTPVAYVVGAATNAEGRTGYVYVSGHVHTVTQDGLGATISPESAAFEAAGGTGTISVTPPDRMSWQARANVDWVNVSPVSGTGAGTVTFTVAPLNEVVTRQGTLTVGGQTFTVFQYGRRIKLSPKEAEYDYLTHVIPITVDALAITSWTVEPKNSWISVVDGGNGHGGDLVTVAIGENPSWKARTGTVKIGTETFTVTQAGRTALEFGISPEKTTASVEGANGLIAVTATPDLPWSAASQANWLTIYSDTGAGAGNGNVVYSAAPNPTLYERTGKITVTPGDSKVSAKTHTVTQPAAVSALSGNGYEFAAAGESCEVRVSLSDIVQWQIENKLAWLTVSGSTNRVGPGTVTLQAAPNDTVYPRSGTVTIARRPFKVSQKARGVEVEYETKLFGTDGGSDSISIHPDGQVSWTAVSSDKTWITIFGGGSGTGDGEILYFVSPYVGDGAARTGTITVGDKVVYITQRAYDLSIDPAGAVVPGNNGAGEFGVSASIGDVWTAIVTEPWITIIEGYDKGTGNGTVRFLYTDNDTGKMRTGKIIVAGEVYTLTQKARELVEITAVAEHGGTVEGAGPYDLGTKVTLTAVPDSGYEFSHWTGDIESMENPLVFNADVPKSFTAVFAPLPIAFESVVSGTNGVTLAWNDLAWATHYLLYRGTTSVPSSATVLADIPNTGDCTFLDDTGELEVEYWYWIEAEGVEDDVMSDPMTGKKKWGWPVAKDDAEVAAALVDAEDARLGKRIGSVGEYEAFRAWSAEEGREEKAVKESEHAWPSYLLGADTLFENEPTIQIDGLSVDCGSDGARAVGTSWQIRVTVKDGEKAASVDADKVAALFEATRQIGDWTAPSLLPLSVTARGSDGDTLLFEVTPGGESTSSAFLRLGE